MSKMKLKIREVLENYGKRCCYDGFEDPQKTLSDLADLVERLKKRKYDDVPQHDSDRHYDRAITDAVKLLKGE